MISKVYNYINAGHNINIISSLDTAPGGCHWCYKSKTSTDSRSVIEYKFKDDLFGSRMESKLFCSEQCMISYIERPFSKIEIKRFYIKVDKYFCTHLDLKYGDSLIMNFFTAENVSRIAPGINKVRTRFEQYYNHIEIFNIYNKKISKSNILKSYKKIYDIPYDIFTIINSNKLVRTVLIQCIEINDRTINYLSHKTPLIMLDKLYFLVYYQSCKSIDKDMVFNSNVILFSKYFYDYCLGCSQRISDGHCFIGPGSEYDEDGFEKYYSFHDRECYKKYHRLTAINGIKDMVKINGQNNEE
jgi:hypothetical protein